MADLAQNRARIGQQDRPVYRRDSVLPRRQGVGESPQRRGSIDVRAGRRGDGGATEVLALARQINGAFEDVQKYDFQKYVYDEQQNAFKAVADEELGKGPDAALMEESEAYKAAYSLSKIEGEMADAKPRVLERAQSVIDGYEGADLTALMKSVEEAVDGELQSLLLDENGQVRDLGTAQAFAIAANRVGALTDQVRSDARNVARKKIAENGTTAEVNRALGMVRNNEVLDVPKMFETLKTYGLSDDDQRGTLLSLIEIIDREDPAKAAAISSQLLGLPSDVKSIRAPGTVTTTVEKLAPSGKLPVSGRVTSKTGDGRNHNGVDIDGRIGDPVEAPAGGRVIKVSRDANQRAGIHVVVDHGNGVTSSYSHLDAALVEEGDLIRPGQKFATVGNTGNVKKGPNGDGSHLHWVVREGKKTVNPLEFQFPEYEAEASVVELAKAGQDTTAAPTLIIPQGLKFNTEQLGLLSGMREQAVERQRVLVERAEKERHEATGQQLYTDLLNGSMPSDDKLKSLVASGNLDPDTAYNFKSLRESKIEADRARAERAEDRAEARANRSADENVARIAMEWNVGEGPTDVREFQSWARQNMHRLGTGTNRLQNYNMLYGVVQRKSSATTGNPEFKMYNGMVGNLFPTNGSGVFSARGAGSNDKNLKLQAQLKFRTRVEGGEDPATAYLEVAKEYGREGQAKAGSSLLMVDRNLNDMEQRRREAGIQ
jgi:murein DD-endopeptidase MepM/ murein hydrolase activator NlpD